MSNVVYVDFGGPGPLLTKKQLADHPAIKRSIRWVEQKLAAGMPSSLDQRGRRRFRLEEVLAWLAGPKQDQDRTPPEAPEVECVDEADEAQSSDGSAPAA